MNRVDCKAVSRGTCGEPWNMLRNSDNGYESISDDKDNERQGTRVPCLFYFLESYVDFTVRY